MAGIAALGAAGACPCAPAGLRGCTGFKVASGFGWGSGVMGRGGKAYAGGRNGGALRNENGSPLFK